MLSSCRLERKVKHEHQSLRNHILSIHKDSTVVDIIKDFFPQLPFHANLRNGLWYHNAFSDHCYFKSTDGHYNEEVFSLNRLNLHTAVSASENHGIVIVDSTRKGKKFPDSMSSTIPIWCAMLNAIVFENGNNFEKYFYPPDWLPQTHSNQICLKMQSFLNNEMSKDYISIIQNKLQNSIKFPLRPVWVCPSTDGSVEWFSSHFIPSSLGHSNEYSSQKRVHDNNEFLDLLIDSYKQLDYLPIVLLSVSAFCTESDHLRFREECSWNYIQGAGDDHVGIIFECIVTIVGLFQIQFVCFFLMLCYINIHFVFVYNSYRTGELALWFDTSVNVDPYRYIDGNCGLG